MSEVLLMGDPRVAAVPVEECGDELVDTRQLGIASDPAQNPQNTVFAYVRRSVGERLLVAQDALPHGFRILLAEGYRPYEQQALYFDRRTRRVMDADPALTPESARLKASEFVSPPDIAPHVSGAAVDLTLVDDRANPLDMGTAIDARPEDCDGACYFDAPNIGVDARRNRATLAYALGAAGFVNYPTDWWHWSYGDRYWALMTGERHAIFGPMHLTTDTPRDQW